MGAIVMPNMFLVETMTMSPNACMACGKGNVPDGVTGKVGPFLNLGIDYNWGDSGYLCGDCIAQAAVMFGWISPDTKLEMEREAKRLRKEIHDLEATIDQRRRRERNALRRVRALESS